MLAGVESDLRSPIDAAMRERVLERMIDEELLVQRALDLGLAVIDRRVRGELTSGLIDSIVSEADAEEPSERRSRSTSRRASTSSRAPDACALERSSSPARPREGGAERTGRRTTDALARAQEAAARLAAGEAPSEVEAALGDSQVSPLPDVLLPASKVRDYVGPTLLERSQTLEIGAWSDPVESAGGVYLAQLVDREAVERAEPRFRRRPRPSGPQAPPRGRRPSPLSRRSAIADPGLGRRVRLPGGFSLVRALALERRRSRSGEADSTT